MAAPVPVPVLLAASAKAPAVIRCKSKVYTQLSDEENRIAKEDEELLKRVEAGDLDFVLASKRRAPDLDIADEHKVTAVHKAMRQRKEGKPSDAILRVLIERGAHVDVADNQGETPIVHAIKFDNQPAIKTLLAAKDAGGEWVVDRLQVNSKTGNTLMHCAAWYDRDEAAALLLDTEAFTRDVLALANHAGQTPMHVASFRATPGLIEKLVAAGSDPEAKTTNPKTIAETPLQLASDLGKPENVASINALTSAVHALRFASRMKRRRNAAAAKRAAVVMPPVDAEHAAFTSSATAAAVDTAVLTLRLEGSLQLFTADVEDALIVKLAKAAQLPVEHVVVLSRTAGSVILELAARDPTQAPTAAAAQTALNPWAAVESATPAELSAAFGHTVLERTVATRPVPVVLPSPRRATPGYRALPAVQSPRAPPA